MNDFFKNNSRNYVQRHRAPCEYGAIKMLYFIIIILFIYLLECDSFGRGNYLNVRVRQKLKHEHNTLSSKGILKTETLTVNHRHTSNCFDILLLPVSCKNVHHYISYILIV